MGRVILMLDVTLDGCCDHTQLLRLRSSTGIRRN